MIRRFRMVGIDNNVEIDLNDFNKYLLTLPDGLGIEFKNTFITIGTQRVNVRKEREYKPITGTIEVCGYTRDEIEENYNKLRDFVARNITSGVKLYYKNTQNNERYVICNIKLLGKGEKNTYCLPIPVSFEPRSLWLEDKAVSSIIKSSEVSKNSVAFMVGDDPTSADDYFYAFYENLYDNETTNWFINYVSSSLGVATIENTADAETPLLITITSPCVNPYIQIIDVNGKTIQSLRVFVTLNEGDTLTINSNPENLAIVVRRVDGTIQNVTNSVDVSLSTFLTLPIGTYNVQISDELNNAVSGNINYSVRYLGG